jgi:PAS domain S-box-containing protein
MTDVDERLTAAEELKRRERYLAEGQRLSRTASFSWRVSDKNLLYLSDEGYRIFGIDPEKGPPGWGDRVSTIHPDDRERWIRVQKGAIEQRSDYEVEYRIPHHSGVIKHARVVGHAVFDNADRLVEYVGTVIDTTDQHKAEEAMRETERRLRLIIETIPALVWSTKPDGDTIFANRQFLRYVGQSSDALRHPNWLSMIHPEDVEETRSSWVHSLETGERHERTHRIRRIDGVYRWFRTIAEPLRDEEGNISQWYGLNIDIDDSRNMEETLRATQARLSRATQIATVAELSASIAHEINQPLVRLWRMRMPAKMWLSSDTQNRERARVAIKRIVRDGIPQRR